MYSSAEAAFTYGTTNEHRPVFRGKISARAFIAEYLQWCHRFHWKGTDRTQNLRYCVDRKYVNFVKRIAYPNDDGVPIDWETMKARFIERYAIDNEDAIALEEKEKDLNDREASRMREDESVGDFSNRFEELCGKINRLRRRLAGEEPPKPTTVLRELKKKFKEDVDTLRANLFGTPTLTSSSSTSSSSGSSPTQEPSATPTGMPTSEEIMQFKEAKATIWSDQYLAAVKNHEKWSSNWKPPMDDQEMLRLFMSRLNRLYYDKAHNRFIPLRNHTLREVIAWMREVERVESRSRPRVNYPSAAQVKASITALEQKREIDELKEQLATLKDHLKTDRLNNSHPTISVATGTHTMHPDRQRLQYEDRDDGRQHNVQSPNQGYGGRRCPLCNSTKHTSMWQCPNVCAKCGGDHISRRCNRTDLYCNYCRIPGHSEIVCSKKKSGVHPRGNSPDTSSNGKRPQKSLRRGRERTHDSKPRSDRDVCWNWREKGSCRFGDRCRFSHQGSPAKRPRHDKPPAPTPTPIHQAATPQSQSLPPMINGVPPIPYNAHGYYGMNPMPTPYPIHQMYGGGLAQASPRPPPIPNGQPAQETPPPTNAPDVIALVNAAQEANRKLHEALGSPIKPSKPDATEE